MDKKSTPFERGLRYAPWILLWGLAPAPLYIWAVIAISGV